MILHDPGCRKGTFLPHRRPGSCLRITWRILPEPGQQPAAGGDDSPTTPAGTAPEKIRTTPNRRNRCGSCILRRKITVAVGDPNINLARNKPTVRSQFIDRISAAAVDFDSE